MIFAVLFLSVAFWSARLVVLVHKERGSISPLATNFFITFFVLMCAFGVAAATAALSIGAP